MVGQILDFEAKRIKDAAEKIGEKRGDERGKKIGEDKGEKKTAMLMKILFDTKRYEDAKRAADDDEYRKKLFEELMVDKV